MSHKPSWDNAPAWATHLLVLLNEHGPMYTWAEYCGGKYLGEPAYVGGIGAIRTNFSASGALWEMLEARPKPDGAVQTLVDAGHEQGEAEQLIAESRELQKSETRLMNLRMDLQRVIAGEPTICSFEEVRHIKVMLAERDAEIAQLRQGLGRTQAEAESLVSKVRRAMERLTWLRDDCAEVCAEAEEVESKHRQAEFDKALAAVAQALGIPADTGAAA